MRKAFYWLGTALLLAGTAGGAIAQTPSIPGIDQSGDASSYLNLQAANRFGADADTANNDPEGLYNWKTSYSGGPTVVSYSTSAASGAMTTSHPEQDSAAVPYLSLGTAKFEQEFGSSASNRDYSWESWYTFSGKVAYTVTKATVGRTTPLPLHNVVPVHQVPAISPIDQDPIAAIPKPASIQPAEATVFSLMNQ